jgi:hypothetical protein
MKRYLLFAGPHYYPAGGVDDLITDLNTMVHVVKEIRDIRADWWNVLDTQTGQTYSNYHAPNWAPKELLAWAKRIDNKEE